MTKLEYYIKIGPAYVKRFRTDYLDTSMSVDFAVAVSKNEWDYFCRLFPSLWKCCTLVNIIPPKDMVIKVGTEVVARIDPNVVSSKFSLNEKIVKQIKDGKTVTISLENR